MARASQPTLLSLDRWAAIMQLNPVHFNGAFGESVWPYGNTACKDIWRQYTWQSPDIVSREEVARHIYLAEVSIMRQLGYAAAPTWFASEEHKHLRMGTRGYNNYPLFQTKYRHVIAGGRRGVTEIETSVPITYSDPDGDGFNELATITISGVTETTDAREVQVFFAGKNAAPAWQIRPLKTISLSSEVYTATFDSWLCINPALWEALPLSMYDDYINITTTDNYVDEVDIYRVFNSQEQATAQLYAGEYYYCSACGNNGCELCSTDGCLLIRDNAAGEVQTIPASWDDETSVWVGSSCGDWGVREKSKIWYYAGYQSEDYKSGLSDDPLDTLLAEAIAMLATSRLPRPVCSCSNVRQVTDDLRKDYAFSDKNSFNLIWRSGHVQNNPFGSKAGEVKAWQIVNAIMGDAIIGSAM